MTVHVLGTRAWEGKKIDTSHTFVDFTVWCMSSKSFTSIIETFPYKINLHSFFSFSFLFFFLFRTAPAAYGSFQNRGWIRAAVAAYTTNTAIQDPSSICNQHHCSQQCWILNPMSGARDQTPALMDTSRVHYPWATMWTRPHSFKCFHL